jgi:hypothetical protein
MTGHRGTTYEDACSFTQHRIVAEPYQFIQDRFGRWRLPGGDHCSYTELAAMLRGMGLGWREVDVLIYRAGGE